MLSMQPQLRPRAGGVGPRPTGSTARPCFARCSPTSAANRGSVRWFGRQRLKMKTAAGSAVSVRCRSWNEFSTSTGLKHCSSLRAHPAMSRCVAIDGRGWMRSRLAIAVACPNISKPRFVENSIGSNCCSSRSRLWRPSGTPCSTQNRPKRRPPPMLLGVHGVGPEFASVLWSEGLSRHFDNRRQVAAYAGLAPTPWQSGSVNREQGISQSGNPRLRTMMIQLA